MKKTALLVTLLLICLYLTACTPVVLDTPAPLTLEAHGATLHIGMSESDALALLGDSYTVSEAQSCAGVGLDRMYTFPSLRLYVFAPEGGTPCVSSVSYTDDGVATGALGIGCTEQAVWDTLGKPDETSEGRMIYRRADTILTVTLKDGCVVGVVLSGQ